jgi:hypothetical protein
LTGPVSKLVIRPSFPPGISPPNAIKVVLTPGLFDPEFASCTLGFFGVLKRFFDPRSFLF